MVRSPKIYFLIAALGTTALPRGATADSSTAPFDSATVSAMSVSIVPNDVLVRRAGFQWRTGEIRDALQTLESVDFTSQAVDSTGALARASLLRAVGALRLGDASALQRALADASRLPGNAAERPWIGALETMADSQGILVPAATSTISETPVPDASLLALDFLLREGNAAAARSLLDSSASRGIDGITKRWVEARIAEALGQEASSHWKSIVEEKPKSPFERELVGVACLLTAAHAIEQGDDAEKILERVPRESSAARRAYHMRGLLALQRGDREQAMLSFVEAFNGSYETPEDRAVGLARSAEALEAGRFADARDELARMEIDWSKEGAALERAATSSSVELPVRWDSWLRERPFSLPVGIDPEPLASALEDAVQHALRGEPSPAPFDAVSPLRIDFAPSSLDFTLPAPDSVLAGTALDLERDRATVDAELRAARAALDEKQRELEMRLRYMNRGGEKTDQEIAELRALLARIRELMNSTDEALAGFARARDEAIRRIAERTATFLEHCENNEVAAAAIHRFRVQGPNSTRPEVMAPGVPSPVEILEQEFRTQDSLRVWIEEFAALMPELIRRSHDEVWRPRVTEGPSRLLARAQDQLAFAERIRASIDSSIAAYRDPAILAALETEIRNKQNALAELQVAVSGARQAALAEALVRARARQAAEGEGIQYSLAIASHELAVAEAKTRALAVGESGTYAGAAPQREDATLRLRDFLTRYPESAARSEIRYRLADAEILAAREDFQMKMASFLGATEGRSAQGTTALAPFVDYEPAVTQYRALLAEDSTYAHRDAVLYQAGMLLSDQGDPSGRPYLEELVTVHEESPFRARASLRLGDDDFEQREFGSAALHFARAAELGDDEVAPIALYKLGWVHLNADRGDSAAAAFFALLERYEEHPDALALTDLRREGEESLIHALSRTDAANTFGALFGNEPKRGFDARVLTGLAQTLRSANQYEDAVTCDSLFLERHGESPEALDTARHWIATLEEASRVDAALDARLALAPRFVHDSSWAKAVADDSLRTAGDEFARSSTELVALDQHDLARASKDKKDWEKALSLHEALLAGWPAHAEAARNHFLAGEAASALRRHDVALAHFERACADSGKLGVDAAWQLVAVRDEMYEDSAAGRDSTKVASESSANDLIRELDRFVATRSEDSRVPEALWRKGDIALRHGRFDESAKAYEDFLARAPRDSRAPAAAHAAARAYFDAAKFTLAGDAFERAMVVAGSAGADSLAQALAPLVPLCHFKEAERVDADSAKAQDAAELFEKVAMRWPRYEFADRALYRSGLAYSRAGMPADAVRSWNTLLESQPKSDLVRDAHLQIASTWKGADRLAAAARAYERFSEAFPKDEEAQSALLAAADLLAESKDEAAAEEVRTRYMKRFPDDVETAAAILETRAGKDLASVGPDRPLSQYLKQKNTALADYLALAKNHPDLASKGILGQVAFIEGEEARAAYEKARLTQPLAPSITAKKKLLESVLREYRQCADVAMEPWSVAAAYRMGESLVHFGEALKKSERPADLQGDDLAAYEEVLETQSWEFFDKGEDAWTQLLKGAKPKDEETQRWVVKTREELWPRIAKRFVHRPELEYPLIVAVPPEPPTTTALSTGAEGKKGDNGS